MQDKSFTQKSSGAYTNTAVLKLKINVSIVLSKNGCNYFRSTILLLATKFPALIL